MKKLILGIALSVAACDAGPTSPDATVASPTECSGPTDCAAGYTCSAGFDTGAGVINRSCQKDCAIDDDCTGTGSICQSQHPPGGGAPDYCTTGCDPITADGCPDDWGCHIDYTWGESPGQAFTFCRTNELIDTAGGEICSPFSTCPSGFSCWNAGGGLKCLETCVAGDGCTIVPEWQLDGVQYGVRP